MEKDRFEGRCVGGGNGVISGDDGGEGGEGIK